MPEPIWPVFEGSAEDRFRQVVRWINGHFTASAPNVFLAARAGMRTPQSVVQTRKLNTGTGCVDMATIAAIALEKNKIRTQVALYRVLVDQKPASPHFMVLADLDGKHFTLDPLGKTVGVLKGWPIGRFLAKRASRRHKIPVWFQFISSQPIPAHAEKKPALLVTGFTNWLSVLRNVRPHWRSVLTHQSLLLKQEIHSARLRKRQEKARQRARATKK